jgi:DNA-binding transcriptional LysR family regulator
MASLDWYVRNELKPKHLHLLIALDEFRNVGRVAAYANVTQPAVSKTLAAIEKGLGAKLFERTSRGIIPTPYGECMIRHARGLLNGFNRARDELKGMVSGTSNSITVGMLANVISALLPQSVALLTQRLPGINVLLRDGTMDRLVPQLLEGELDLIVGRIAEKHHLSELGSKILSAEPIVLICGPHHPLAQRKGLLWKDLIASPWVIPAAESLLREPFERILEHHNLMMPTHYVETLSVQFVTSYLLLTTSIATMTRDVAHHYREKGQVAILDFDFPRLVRPLGITWNKQRPMSASTALLIECLEEIAASGTPA